MPSTTTTLPRRSPGTPLRLRHGRLLLRLTLAAFAVIALVSFVVAPVTGHFGGQFEDFQAYLDAARSMAHGQSPYAHFDPGVSVTMSGFLYPPFAAVLVRPLALLSDRAAITLWLWIGLASTIAGCVIVARTALPRTWPRTELGLLAALAFPPATYNYWHGQVNPVIFLFLALAYRAWMRREQTWCGVFIGVAASIKVAPAVLVLLLLRRRWWKGSLAFVATGAVSVAIGILGIGVDGLRTYSANVLPAVSQDVGWIYNQSVAGVLSRLVGHAVTARQPTVEPLHALVLLATLAVLAVAVWAVRPAGGDGTSRSAQFGVGVTAMVLAESIAWYPHYTHMLIPVFIALGVVAARGWEEERRLAWAVGAFLLGIAVLTPIGLAQWGLPTVSDIMRTPLWWPFLQLCSLPAIVAAALMWRLRTAGAAAQG